MNLRPYQVEGVAWLRTRKHALLADAMRLGKTAQAIRAANGCLSIGVVCPASAVGVWHEQFAKWQMASSRTSVASYDKVTRGEFDGQSFDVLILDEAHYLKSAGAKRTQKVYGPKCDGVGGLIAKAERVYALTGTPCPNHPGEIWPTLRALAPETIPHKNGKPMSYWQFITRYCKTKDNGFGLQIVGGKNLEALRMAMEPFVLRRRFNDVVQDAQEPVFDTLPVAGRAPDESEIRKLLQNCKTDEEILAAIKKHSTHVASTRRLTGLAKVKGVIDWFRDFKEGDGGKVVFMAYHRDVIHELSTGLAGVLGYEVPVVTGATLAHVRAAALRDFRKPEIGAFVGQIIAAGTAVDLSSADTLVFVESDWVPGNNEQAAMRIQAVDKKALLTIYAATLPGSIDEKIQRANLRKVRDSLQIFG